MFNGAQDIGDAALLGERGDDIKLKTAFFIPASAEFSFSF